MLYGLKTSGNIDAKVAVYLISFSTSSNIREFESFEDYKVFAAMGLGTRRAHSCTKTNSTGGLLVAE